MTVVWEVHLPVVQEPAQEVVWGHPKMDAAIRAEQVAPGRALTIATTVHPAAEALALVAIVVVRIHAKTHLAPTLVPAVVIAVIFNAHKAAKSIVGENVSTIATVLAEVLV